MSQNTGKNVHVVPVDGCDPNGDEHDADSLGCWCAPSYNLPCDECEVEIAPDPDASERIFERGDGCWKCTAGLIPLTRAQAEAADRPLVIVHNR